jgi:hypothetical protein
MNARSDVSSCANPKCHSKFVRFGDGELYVFPIADPQAWGLPPEAKQKVLWLCERCRSALSISLDRSRHLVQVVSRGKAAHRVA